MIINTENIKAQLGVTSSTYDARINMAIPQILDQICSECRNDFVKINWSNYPVYKQGSLTITSTTISTNTDISLFTPGDFIRLYGTEYNDGLYQVKTNTEEIITIETTKTMRAEAVKGYIALIDFPTEFLTIVSDYINKTIVNSCSSSAYNIVKEKVPDYEVEYDTKASTIDLQNYSSSLNNYRMIYHRGLFR